MYYSGFPFPETTEIIVKALTFARSKIREYYEIQKKAIDKTHSNTIDRAMETELREIDALVTFLKKHVMLTWTVDPKEYERMNYVIRSALDIYIADLEETKRRTNLGVFERMITEAEEVRKIEAIRRAKTGLFGKYYSPLEGGPSGYSKNTDAVVEQEYSVFMAYDDGTGYDFAEHLKRELENRGTLSFVARKDIPPEIKHGEGWRKKIDSVIETCNTFILILSTDKLSLEVTRETKLAFDRNRRDPKFSIIIAHLLEMPRTNEQLLSAGIDSKDFQQLDFETKYDLARKVTPKLDERGMPKPRSQEAVEEQEVMEDSPAGALATAQIALYLVAYSWFITWVFGQDFASALGLFGVSSIVILIVAYGKSWTSERAVPFCKKAFPMFLFVSICCLSASFGLQYTLSLYPTVSGFAHQTYLTDAPTVSLYLLLATVAGGVLLDLPRLSRNEIRLPFSWVRGHRRYFFKGVAVALLVIVVCASLVPIDSNLVLFAPKVGLVETRYATDGAVHVYQIGLASLGAWSENREIVHVMKPLFPLVSESYYSFFTNSSKPPSILSATGLSVSSPTEDSPNKIVVKVTTDSTSTTDAQFSVQFYSEFDVKQLAYIDFGPSIFIRNFPNGTQQLQRQFVIINHSGYDLRLDRIILYEEGYAPTNQTMIFSPLEVFPHPDLSYDNSTRTLSLYGVVYQHGNLTVTVSYNSY